MSAHAAQFGVFLKGVVPMGALRALLAQIPPRPIPWEFVDLIETDPARRVKLKISHERLARLHPADIADIVEESGSRRTRSGLRDPGRTGSRRGPGRSRIPRYRRRLSSLSTPIAPPKLWKKWIPMRPPIFWRTYRRNAPRKSCWKWRPRSARKWSNCWSSRRTPPPAG